jgi:RasGEF domain
MKKLKNFDGLMMCAAVVNTSVIQRLKASWKLVAGKQAAKWNEISALLNPVGSFANYRKHLHECKPPLIPFLGRLLTDLTFTNVRCVFVSSARGYIYIYIYIYMCVCVCVKCMPIYVCVAGSCSETPSISYLAHTVTLAYTHTHTPTCVHCCTTFMQTHTQSYTPIPMYIHPTTRSPC